MHQWQKEAVAFLGCHHARLGAGSFANQLRHSVARDIVELAKPKEEYGFIKNFTDKPIIYLSFTSSGSRYWLYFIKGEPLIPQYQKCFIDKIVRPGEYYIFTVGGISQRCQIKGC